MTQNPKCLPWSYVCPEKKKRSGTTSIVVVDKSRGRFGELKTVGVSSSQEELSSLEQKARLWIDEYSGQQTFDFDESSKVQIEVENAISTLRERSKTPLRSS